MTAAKPPFVNDSTLRADSTVWQLASRQMRLFVSGSRFWAILGAVGFVIALAGPFYTLERLSFPARLVYWGATALVSGVLMTFLSTLMRRLAVERGWHWVPASLATSAIGVLPIMTLIAVANRLSSLSPEPFDFWHLFPYVAIPVTVITMLVNALIDDPAPLADEIAKEGMTADAPAAAADRTDTAPVEAEPSVLFAKLPAALGREIVALQARDHYIDVTTTLGSALVLMRLSDAERDLASWDGMRVHRSWWVSLAHVQQIEKGTSGPELRLSTGQIVPISRNQRAAVRDALAARKA
jgi:hypothetical protein